MPTNDFHFRLRYANLARKKRAQLGVCLAALRRGGDPDFQRTVRELARNFGFRTLRGYLHRKRRRWPLREALFQELMQSLAQEKEPGLYSRWRRRRTSEPTLPDYPLQ